MHRLLLALMAVGEGLIFWVGNCIIITAVGFIMALYFKSSIIAYFILGGWTFSGIIVLVVLVKALREGTRFIESFDHKEHKKEPAGISSA